MKNSIADIYVEKKPLSVIANDLTVKCTINLKNDEIISEDVPYFPIHKKLYQAEKDYRNLYLNKFKKPIAKKQLGSANILTASIGILYSDVGIEEGYIGKLQFDNIFVKVLNEKNVTFSTCNFFKKESNYAFSGTTSNKALRNHAFEDNLAKRINLFNELNYFNQNLKNVFLNAKQFYLASDKGNFHETFHHSEQALMHYLESEIGIDFISKYIFNLKATTIAGIIFDINSTRTLCVNCNVGLIGFQNSHENGFIKNLTNLITDEDHRLETPEKLLWTTRVSAGIEAKSSPTKKIVPQNKDIHIATSYSNNPILQGKNDNLKLISEEFNNELQYKGDFFTSRCLRKKRFEKQLEYNKSI